MVATAVMPTLAAIEPTVHPVARQSSVPELEATCNVSVCTGQQPGSRESDDDIVVGMVGSRPGSWMYGSTSRLYEDSLPAISALMRTSRGVVRIHCSFSVCSFDCLGACDAAFAKPSSLI